MEFPDDVLCLIREFSRPRMKFIPEYKKVMRDLGMVDWNAIKKRLCDKDAEQVITTLLAWADAFLITEQLQTLPNQDQSMLWLQVMRRDRIHRQLQVLLVGEETVRKHERWLTYEEMYSDEDY